MQYLRERNGGSQHSFENEFCPTIEVCVQKCENNLLSLALGE